MTISIRTSVTLLVVMMIVLVSVTSDTKAAPSDPDVSFGVGGTTFYDTFPLVSSMAPNNQYYSCCHLTQQTDGKTIVAGATDTDKMLKVIRFNVDGTVDLTYGLSGQAVMSAFPSIVVYGIPLSIKIDRYGKLLVAGYFVNTITGLQHFSIWRFNTNGLLDTTFGNEGRVAWIDTVDSRAAAITTYQDTIFVLRWADLPGLSDTTVHALNNDGASSALFGGSGLGKITINDAEDLAIQPVSNKLLVATKNDVRRYSLQGTADTTFGTQGVASLCAIASPGVISLSRMAVQANGKIVAARTLNTVQVSWGFYSHSFTKLTDRGRLDNTFDGNGCQGHESYWDIDADVSGIARSVRIQTDGRIVTSSNRRYNVDGSVDTTYFPWNRLQTQDVWIQQHDGRIVSLAASDNSAFQSFVREDYFLFRFLP